MLSFGGMGAELNSGLDMFLHCYPPLTYQCKGHSKGPMDGIDGT